MGARRAHTCRMSLTRPRTHLGNDSAPNVTHLYLESGNIMKALVYSGPGRKAWKDVPTATIQDKTDAVIRVDCTTICGTDLHILKGDVPEVTKGRILGHEAVGTVETIGSAVSTVKPGDRVLVSCISVCGRCGFCREGRYGQCLGGGGWILGHRSTGPRLSTFGYPLPIPRRTRCPRERAMRRSSCSPTSCPHRTKLES